MFIHSWNEPYMPSLLSHRASLHFGRYSVPIPCVTGGCVGVQCVVCICSVPSYTGAVHQFPVHSAEHWWTRQTPAWHSRPVDHLPHSCRSCICSVEDSLCQLNIGISLFRFLTGIACIVCGAGSMKWYSGGLYRIFCSYLGQIVYL